MTDDNRVVERSGWAPVRHFAERSVAGLVAVVLAGLAFGALVLLVRTHWSPLLRLDRSVARSLNEVVAPHEGLVKALTTVTSLGGRGVLLPLAVMAIVLLLIRRRPRLALYLAVTGAGALLLDPSLKTLVGRVRPVVAEPIAYGQGNSFPSGHTLGATIVYGMLALVVLSATRRHRGWVVAAAVLIPFVVGLTRLALGVHFLSDVLAGWLLGLAWISITAYAFRLWRREAGHPTPPLEAGLEPEAAGDLAPAPAEDVLLPHPWAKGAEILVAWVLTFGLLYVVGYALTRWAPGTWLGDFDDGVPRWLQETFRTDRIDHLSWLASKAGDTHAILFVSLIFCPIALALWRQWRPVLFLVLTMMGELTLFLCAAAATGRPRPPVEQMDGQMPTSSFPSGHIAATMCLWVAIAVIAVPRIRQWWRWVFVALAVLMPALVALSRMYRGMHHPTDVLGAALLTLCWVGALYFIVRPNEKPVTVTEAASVVRRPVIA